MYFIPILSIFLDKFAQNIQNSPNKTGKVLISYFLGEIQVCVYWDLHLPSCKDLRYWNWNKFNPRLSWSSSSWIRFYEKCYWIKFYPTFRGKIDYEKLRNIIERTLELVLTGISLFSFFLFLYCLKPIKIPWSFRDQTFS